MKVNKSVSIKMMGRPGTQMYSVSMEPGDIGIQAERVIKTVEDGLYVRSLLDYMCSVSLLLDLLRDKHITKEEFDTDLKTYKSALKASDKIIERSLLDGELKRTTEEKITRMVRGTN